MVAIFVVGVFGNFLVSLFKIEFSIISISILLLFFIYVNAYFYYTLIEVKKTKSIGKLRALSFGQIALELIVFSVVLYLSGEKSLISVFFFLPIISASIIFGIRGAIITALMSVVLVNISVVSEYFYFIVYNVTEDRIMNGLEFAELKRMTISLITVIVTSNFYIIVAIFLGYGSKLFATREQALIESAEKMNVEKEVKEREMKEIDRSSKILQKKDEELEKTNKILEIKIKELEKSEKSLIRAFSDLQEARRRALEERNKTSAVIANFIDPILVIDAENKLSLFNPAAEEIFGIIRSDLGKKIDGKDNYSMNNFVDIIEQDYEVRSHKIIKSNNPNEEEVLVNFGTQELTYKVITAPVIDNMKRKLGIMKIFYNLTREKMIDKLKSEFISIAAHQLRTPLSAIKWVIKMVLDGDVGKLNSEQEKLLFKGYQSNERIIGLVNDMLNVSRIEEGRFGYSFKQDNFEDALQDTIDNLETRIKNKSIKFIINKPAKIPLVYMDRQKMGLVLQNLLENAVKYTPEFGKIEIFFEVGIHFLKIKIKDNGVGIPKEDQKKLFSKFFRADNVIRMQTEGSGLGLFIVKNVIEKHGGEITFESKEGVGTTFIFTLPINK
ncbi:hypothetical protein A2331_05785 [Candidatus Falkowbacteria bacterium RIFOXYB2_FULL_34_18]|uniref:histidine kinase n=1 Tax=Candidatus Falkowbacteria bacterium RIFOXYD2_FULL_34_120 TaxID=1798007 RepID=A0A1F5TLT0_9BACT|nr:MAG: hypothetical protein A2331_05785 [Candidatus Falkowbacteria bacterium RIFOXYB2_FULL_34_18]OGF29156.1 MAG: hypothetical protein A2500_05730 [Candidatus Falkowbacteria bacterium RIFOXYC12_FULL_34_55]OGF36962.1 MAG: hypothetical protein A2466_07110 [Candidatus Falkowbacteria bacterium RIFOXYC2_FULL_34_220]OGF38678.1 MAG: hypothetical protein A2515_01395 [Candidatus Falkowbacteria bacterium RIFOXYD12_FULL_34_57]OGF39912.1 MAG: hypothetical protein A2531_01650 [Candidatus Falkowbacteria bact